MSAFISNVLAVIMTLISIIMPAKPNNVELTVRKITTESTSISFEIKNNTGRLMGRPNVSLIEKKDENGKWQKADINFGQTEEYYNIYPGMSAVDSVFLASESPEESSMLSEGEYRLTVSYRIGTISIETIKGSISSEFTVT